MNEMPHLDAEGNAFFNGANWALVSRRHWDDNVPAWAFDLVAVAVVLAALIGLMLFFAQG